MGISNQETNIELNMPKEAHDVVVIVVPFPCQSHLNQLLHLSCLISSYKIPVHYVGFATHINQAKARFNKNSSPEFYRINFHEFPTPKFHSPPANPNSQSKFPLHLLPSFESSIHLREPVADLFKKISPTARRLIIIHDLGICYTVQDGATLPNAELYGFNPISIFTTYCDARERSPDFSENEFSMGLPSSEGFIAPEFQEFISLQVSCHNLTSGILYNSCRPIEGTYIDLMKNKIHLNKQQWAIGPLNMGTTFEKRDSKTHHKCLEWLDKQTPNSVIYVSFGTTVSMGNDEIKELALGIEQSGQKFIWVFRDADRGNIFEGDYKRIELPKGFEERMGRVGMVVRDWAPQLDILEHPSTGGFMSHCGWNSCLESIAMGVPIAAWPMHSDQPRNAFLITDILKAGVTIRKKDEIVTSTMISKAIKTLMVSKEGEDMRTVAEKLGWATRQAVKEGGISRIELDSLIAHITR